MRRMSGILCALAALWLMFASAAQAQAPEAREVLAGQTGTQSGETRPGLLVSGARIMDFGEFSSNVESRSHSPAVADGIKDRARDFALVKRGALLEARLGSGIGIRYRLLGAPRGASVLLDVVVRHPAMISPDTRQPMTHSEARYERSIGQVAHSVWSFDTPASLLPGDYAIELWYNGRQLARQTFKVTVRK